MERMSLRLSFLGRSPELVKFSQTRARNSQAASLQQLFSKLQEEVFFHLGPDPLPPVNRKDALGTRSEKPPRCLIPVQILKLEGQQNSQSNLRLKPWQLKQINKHKHLHCSYIPGKYKILCILNPNYFFVLFCFGLYVKQNETLGSNTISKYFNYIHVQQAISKLCEKFFLIPNCSWIAEWVAFLAISHQVLVDPPINVKSKTVPVNPRGPLMEQIPLRTYTTEKRIRKIVNINNKNTGFWYLNSVSNEFTSAT